ncbi:gamma-glutamyltransferase family protein [Ovoidimarina sediminis]|uniref:gamma-glutamyltransferase family protein n=1 Tax=Ovoidimarina sediminis TaxID=3079856 RepID=UPI0029099595|nr:gamma-glutamyltransferase [Rhodophyticola sp. MJ-SS7]MDU8945193.1 gamma-glutamyltransferase [Rhodophyticola sp. MJ-SS7]
MIETALGRGMAFTAPHRLATKAGADILEGGGSAVEAMVAAAATIAVVYPHMNAIGGDGFWIIKRKGAAPQGVFACGAAAGLATPEWYAERGHTTALPTRGAEAALTIPATIAGWAKALDLDGSAPARLSDLLADAISHARGGIAVSRNQSETTAEKLDGLADVPGFADVFLQNGAVPPPGARLVQPALAGTFERLAEAGLDDYYRGDIGATHARFLEAAGSPLRKADFDAATAREVTPLTLRTRQGTLYNMIPPTQGMASLAILGAFDRLGVTGAETFDHWHGLIEATKQAFIVRNRELGDTRTMARPAQDLLGDDDIAALARGIDMTRALPWPHEPKDGDTIWMGAVDAEGTVVSFIQSVYWEFGSGLVCPETGVYFQNRGAGFSLAPGPNQLRPGHHPFHTLNPALAELSDGRVMAYGTMGGEGQPQTQAAVFSRYAMFGQPLQAAITAPRWLLGRTWGDETTSLKIESTADPSMVEALRAAGHDVEILPAFSSLMGHAGAVVAHPDGGTESASDPRSDGWAYAR